MLLFSNFQGVISLKSNTAAKFLLTLCNTTMLHKLPQRSYRAFHLPKKYGVVFQYCNVANERILLKGQHKKELQNTKLKPKKEKLVNNDSNAPSKQVPKRRKAPKGYWDEIAQRNAFEKLGKEKMGVKELGDWYSVNATDVIKELNFINTYYHGSVFGALKHLFPQHDWDPLKLKSQVPRGYWKDTNAQREALEKLGREQFGVKELDDWYSVPQSSVKQQLSFITHHYGTLYTTLKTLYPKHNWQAKRFSKVPRGYWEDENNQRIELEKLGREKLGVNKLDDWYAVNAAYVTKQLNFIISHYNGSLFKALKHLYPQHDWDALKLTRQVPRGYWSDENMQRDALEKLGREQLGIKSLDDWYTIPAAVVNKKLSFVIYHYNANLYSALKALYPEHNWDAKKFVKVPRGYWDDENTQREALENLGKGRLGVKELDDWYDVNAADVVKQLSFINTHYRGSVFSALQHLYPQHDWDPLKLTRQVPRGYWNDEAAQRDALEKLGREQLAIKELDDWYNVTASYVSSKFKFIDTMYEGSLANALKKLYPTHAWDSTKFKLPRSGYWTDENMQREALEAYGRERLGIKELDDWYSVSSGKVTPTLRFISFGYNGSLSSALVKLYPQHNWNPLKFLKPPHRYWKKSDTSEFYHKLFIKWQQEYNIQYAKDWYMLPEAQLQILKRACRGLFGSVHKMFKTWFPQFYGVTEQFTSQIELQALLQRMMDGPQRSAQINYNNNMEHIYIPDWKVKPNHPSVLLLRKLKRVWSKGASNLLPPANLEESKLKKTTNKSKKNEETELSIAP